MKRFIKLAFAVFLLVQSANALRVPAHVFPDESSDVLTYIEIDESSIDRQNEVLDSSIDAGWYWTTHKDDFVGYVSKRDVLNRKRLKPGTMIRTNPTYKSWILTKYEPSDRVRVKSRISVGRVSFNKEIPVYFRIPDPSEIPPVTPAETVAVDNSEEEDAPTPVVVEPIPTTHSDPVVLAETPVLPATETRYEEVEVPAIETTVVLPDAPTAIIEQSAEAVPTVEVDPLLEEKPRMSGQELANMAPPPADIYQEFEGFLRVVESEDPQSKYFQYKLNTRSGRRIVYVQTENLRSDSYEQYVDQWINIRGSLAETEEDFALFIDAQSIWVAPEE